MSAEPPGAEAGRGEGRTSDGKAAARPRDPLPGDMRLESILPDRAREDLDASWGGSADDEDDRLLGERPPHWER